MATIRGGEAAASGVASQQEIGLNAKNHGNISLDSR